MNSRLQSLIATVLIHVVLGYLLFMTVAISLQRPAPDRMTLVNIHPERAPPPRRAPSPAPAPISYAGKAVILHDWSTASPAQRNADFIKAFKWVKDNLTTEEDRTLAKWRAAVPQGSGPARVTRLTPANLTTHTVYWPANWSKGPLPIIAWGNGYAGICSNSSLPYAAFLSEIASHGYFVVAVGNDDIDYPVPEGIEFLADGRPIRTKASALRAAVDWAIAENGRAGSRYAGRLDTSKIAYMGHGCGGQQAMTASSDPRTTTTVMLSAPTRPPPDLPQANKGSIVQFDALEGMIQDGAYPGPDRRWSKGIIAWLDLQLKGDGKAMKVLDGLPRNGWSRIDAAGP